jgi:hypothetical protein
MAGAGQAAVSGFQLSAATIMPTEGAGSTGEPSQTIITLSNGVTAVWDGRGDNGNIVTSGAYLVEIQAADGKGGNTVIVKQVIVQDSSMGLGSLSAQPNILTAAGGMTASFTNNGLLGAALKATIYNVAGERVAVTAPGLNKTSWNAQGMASGLYFAVVEFIGPNGGVMGRLTAKILVLH